MDYTKAAEGFGLLADPNRLCILAQLAREGELNATRLLEALPVSQPTLSHHMKLLCEGGLVRRRRLGQRVLYQLDRPALDRLLSAPLGGEAPPPTQPQQTAAIDSEPQRTAPVIVRAGHKW